MVWWLRLSDRQTVRENFPRVTGLMRARFVHNARENGNAFLCSAHLCAAASYTVDI